MQPGARHPDRLLAPAHRRATDLARRQHDNRGNPGHAVDVVPEQRAVGQLQAGEQRILHGVPTMRRDVQQIDRRGKRCDCVDGGFIGPQDMGGRPGGCRGTYLFLSPRDARPHCKPDRRPGQRSAAHVRPSRRGGRQGENAPTHSGKHRPRDAAHRARHGDDEATRARGGGSAVQESSRQGGKPVVERAPHNVGQGSAVHRSRHVQVCSQTRHRAPDGRPLVDVDHTGAITGDDQGHDGVCRVHIGDERGCSVERRLQLGERQVLLERRRSGFRPLPLARAVVQIRRARIPQPLSIHAVGAEHPQLSQLCCELCVRRWTQREHLLAEVARPLRPFEQHFRPARSHGRTEAGQDESVAVHDDGRLQVEAAERALPLSQGVEPRRGVPPGLAIEACRHGAFSAHLVGQQSHVHRRRPRHADARCGALARAVPCPPQLE